MAQLACTFIAHFCAARKTHFSMVLETVSIAALSLLKIQLPSGKLSGKSTKTDAKDRTEQREENSQRRAWQWACSRRPGSSWRS
jgi:hypothetical protein